MTGADSCMLALKGNKLEKRNKQMPPPGIIPVNIEMKKKKHTIKTFIFLEW